MWKRGYHLVGRDHGEEERQRGRLATFIALVAEKVKVRGCEAMAYLDPERMQMVPDVSALHYLESMLLGSHPGRSLSHDAASTAGPMIDASGPPDPPRNP